MKKENYIKDLAEIQGMVGKIKTINEAIRFDEEFGDDDFGVEEPEANGVPSPEVGGEAVANGEANLAKMSTEEEPTEEDGLRELGEVDTIREIALKGMIKLCKNPEDERYQALKKIFQFCDKAAETKDKENVQ